MKDWIDRYLYAIGEKLPKSQKEDIKKELKSIIEDAVDEKVAKEKASKGEYYEATEEDILSIINNLGSPVEVAAKYKPSNKYLIGPELYDLYRFLLIIVLGAVGLGISIASAITVMGAQGTFIELLYKLPLQLISAGMNAVGSVTIVFMIIQHFASENQIKNMNIDEKWNPKELKPIPVSYEIIKPSEAIVTIVFTILALLIFNRFPNIIAIYVRHSNNISVTPIFNLSVLKSYIQYLNIFWVADILLNIYKLKTGKWTKVLRFTRIVISLGVLIIILFMAGNPKILNIDLEGIIISKDLEFLQELGGIGSMAFRIFIVIIILVTIFEIGKHIYYIFKKV